MKNDEQGGSPVGLQDRDYMRERRWRDLDSRPRPFAPPEPTLQSTLQIILFWLVVALALWKAVAEVTCTSAVSRNYAFSDL